MTVARFGILKVGCMGSLPLLEFLIDERADRDDVDVLVIGSGAKLGLQQCETTATLMIPQDPAFVILIGPAQHAPGPTKARKLLTTAQIPTLVISDGPARRLVNTFDVEGVGYIIIDADAMIGARREFLDPTEMALFNADMIKILSITGVLQRIANEIDKLITDIKHGKPPSLPRVIVSKEIAVEASGLVNPYAKAKALAAYEIAKRAATVNTDACFKVKEWRRYTALVASGHEMIRAAARLADTAREIDKGGDSVKRSPHYSNGTLGQKQKLIEKPTRVKGE